MITAINIGSDAEQGGVLIICNAFILYAHVETPRSKMDGLIITSWAYNTRYTPCTHTKRE